MLCPNCHKETLAGAYTCFHCGQKLKNTDTSTGLGAQISLYLISILLPPFNLGKSIRYLKSDDPAAQKIGLISLVLMTLSIILAIWLTAKSIAVTTSTLGL